MCNAYEYVRKQLHIYWYMNLCINKYKYSNIYLNDTNIKLINVHELVLEHILHEDVNEHETGH